MSNRDGEVEGSQSEYSIDDEDQLQPEDTLIDRGVDDVLDEGISPPEKPLALDKFGLTAREQEEGETLDERLSEEVPDVAVDDEPISDDRIDVTRAGRLVAPDEGIGEDREAELVAGDVGFGGGAASAEEAAVHVIDEP